jgi:hypothetical protein
LKTGKPAGKAPERIDGPVVRQLHAARGLVSMLRLPAGL